jgi:hypothetical protein
MPHRIVPSRQVILRMTLRSSERAVPLTFTLLSPCLLHDSSYTSRDGVCPASDGLTYAAQPTKRLGDCGPVAPPTSGQNQSSLTVAGNPVPLTDPGDCFEHFPRSGGATRVLRGIS